MANLSLYFLGKCQAFLNGEPLPSFHSARLQSLLAYLALESDRPHTRSVLAGLLWPDEPEVMAKQNLRQALYQLRQLFEGQALSEQRLPLLLTTRDTVQFNLASDVVLDVHLFLAHLEQQQLERAVALYQGDLLTELNCESPLLEEWLLVTRERLHLQALAACAHLTQNALAHSDYGKAQTYARHQLALDPWREEAHRQLMLALAYAGERNTALVQYETCRRILTEEFAVEPEAGTQQVAEQIRAGNLRPPRHSGQNRGQNRGQNSDSAPFLPASPSSTKELTNEALTGEALNSEELLLDNPASFLQSKSTSANRVDWGEAPDVGPFYGRAHELAQLTNWLVSECCQLIGIIGMGGIGKTTLATQLARQNIARFDFVLWRSLLNAPTLPDLLDGWLRTLSVQPLTQTPVALDTQLSLLFDYLRKYRCLLILDNVESIMQGGERAGYYRAGYEAYGQLLLRMGQSRHQSCLLLTSREQPREVARLEVDTPLVRTLALVGLDRVVGRQLLVARGVAGSSTSIFALIERYSGNPLALKLVAEVIQDFFAGDIDALLDEQLLILEDIRDVLEQQFSRLAPLERDLLLWLAIEREPVTENQLWQRFARTTAKRSFLEALRSLLRRSLVENFVQEKQLSGFGLQNVVTEYLTDYLITQSSQEFATLTPYLLHSHALINAQAKEYIRQSQERIILQPLANRLLAAHGRAQIAMQGKQLLATMQRERPLQSSFLAGNLLNLFLCLGIDVRGYDFSNLSVWHAYLRGADLPALNFSHADLTGSVFTDYAGAVTAVAFSPDGELLAAGADSGVIYLWRVVDRQLIGVCQGHTSHVWSLAFSPDGQQLVSGSGDTTVQLWDVNERRALHVLVGHASGVATVSFHPGSALVASGSLDGTVRLWDIITGQSRQILQADGARIEAVAFNATGALLATGGHDQVVRIWDWQQGQIRQTLQGHTNLIKVLGFYPHAYFQSGKRRTLVVSGGDDYTLHIWDAESGELLQCLAGHTAAIISLAFCAARGWLLSGSDDQTIRVWDLQSGQTIRILHGHYGSVRSLAVQPTCLTEQAASSEFSQILLASGSYDKTIRLWDLHNGHTLSILHGHSKWLQALVFAPDAQGQPRLLVSGSDGQTVRVWDGQSGRALHTLRGHTSLTEKISFRADGLQLASAGWDQTVRIWDLHSGQTRYLLQGHTGAVAAAASGPGSQGRRLIASGGLDRTVRLWDGETGQILAVYHGHRDRVIGFAFRPATAQGMPLLASCSWDSTIGLWDTQRNELLAFLHGHTEAVESVAFHPGGELLASASWDRSVRIWDVRTGQALHVLQGHHDGLEMVTFSPDGALLASCGCDHLICVWDVAQGRLVYQLQGHTSWVRCIAFSPDSTHLASGSDDGTVKLWTVGGAGAGRCLHTVALEDPYTDMNITGVTGITAAQKLTLRALGAHEAASTTLTPTDLQTPRPPL